MQAIFLALTKLVRWSVTANRGWLQFGIVFGFLAGLAIVVLRRSVIPDNFRYDSDHIQQIAQGKASALGDYTFANIAATYRILGLANSPGVVAYASYLLASCVIVFAVWRSRRLKASPVSCSILIVAFICSAVYLGSFSKEICVLLIVIALLALPGRLWGEIVIVVLILVYAIIFRQYWALDGVAFVAYRILNRWWIRPSAIVVFGVAGGAMIGLIFVLGMGVSPNYFRETVNATSLIQANTQLKPRGEWIEPWGGFVNVAFAYFALILPAPLLWTAGIRYLPLILVFAWLWIVTLSSLRNFEKLIGGRPKFKVFVKRAVALLFAFLSVQAVFEPDYGSALRHLTPLLPLIVFISLVLAKGEGSFMRSKPERTVSALMVIHWGSNGGGPWFAVRMAEALSEVWPGGVVTSFNANSEMVQSAQLKVSNDFPVRTYNSVFGLVLGLPRLVLIGLRLRKFIRENEIATVYSAMLSIWQSLCLALFLPSNVKFLASIHDATEHPGDAHWVLRLCRYLDCRRANRILVYSEFSQSKLLAEVLNPKTPVSIIPLGADRPVSHARSLSAINGRPIVLGFVGRIVEYKGLDLFVELVQKLSQERGGIRGLVFGSGEVDSVMMEATAAFIDWHVGWVPESEMASVFEKIDILILSYREASQSGVYSLALSAGVPSVVTPMGGLIAQITSTGGGLIAEAVTVDALAASVLELLRPNVYDQISQKALESAAGIGSWASAAAVLAGVIKDDESRALSTHAS